MAMDITSILVISFSTLIQIAYGKDVYLCTWPSTEVMQLRCDNANCPYLSVEQIIVGRLQGNPASCTELNANKTLRKPIPSCAYQLMESHDFFGQVRNNCSRKQVCEVSSEELFKAPGICGREIDQLDSMRNWMHIKYNCQSDIPGVTCDAEVPTSTEKPTRASTLLTKPRRIVTSRVNSYRSTLATPLKDDGVALVIPILATLLVCTLLLIVATMVYRHGGCRRKKSWQEAIQDRLNHNNSPHTKSTKSHPRLDDVKFRIDGSKLKELEKRLSKNQVMKMNSNEYCHDLSFAGSSTLAKPITKELLEEAKMKNASRKGRRNSLELPPTASQLSLPAEMYFSDTSESTTTEQDFDSTGRRKRRRVKPLPPLPRPVVPHSEVYFTETETESEAPYRTSRRKDQLPKLDPPPRVAKNTQLKHDRLKTHKTLSSIELGQACQPPPHRQSLELALTKGAAKKLNTPIVCDNKVKVTCKKPIARPRTSRSSTSLYGNILMDENMLTTSNNTQTSNNNLAKRSHTVPVNGDYKNLTTR